MYVSLKESLRKFVADLFSTRIQITYLVVGTYMYVTLRTASMMRTVEDGVALLNALWPGVGLVLATYFAGKVVDRRGF